MKKALLLPLLLFTVWHAWAQRPLTDSRTSSALTYFYRLDDEAVRLFYAGKQQQIRDEVFTNPVTSYLTDHPQQPLLAPGNYLKVTAERNRLQYTLIEKRSVFLKPLENSRDVRFILLDADGHEITNAQVYVKNKLISYDAEEQTYHTSRGKSDTLLRVVFNNVSNFYNIKTQYYRPYRPKPYNSGGDKHGFWYKVTQPIRNYFKKPEINRYTPPKTNPGFMVFNKPKYRPGDTIKFKAFIVQKGSKKPIGDREVLVRLKNGEWDNGKIIARIPAYRKGGFAYSFKLDDSLKLSLDDDYYISLESLSSKKYDLDEYDGDLKDEEYLNKRTIYQMAKFRYEDYELKTNQFTLRTDGTELAPGLPVSLYFKATDDNGLNVPDGRVQLTLSTQQASDYTAAHVFIPDTLWRHLLTLEALGETKLTIPDSIFPKAKISFEVKAEFLNSNNESRNVNKWLTYNYRSKKIVIKIDQDTVKINLLKLGKDDRMVAKLLQLNAQNDTLSTTNITLPAQIVANPGVATYIVKADSLTEHLMVGNLDASIMPSGYRTADSLFITVSNPRRLKFWYTIFAGNRVFEQGTGTYLNYKKVFKQNESVSILVNYIWGDKPRYTEQRIPYQDKYLNIAVKQPVSVYPGQQADIEVDVKDDAGKPVAGADITAYALTRKFENYMPPNIPYLGKIYRDRKLKAPLVLKQLINTGSLKLNWQYWSRNAGLDSIQYYQFTHPADVYRMAEPAPDSVTQVAPFVVKDGDILPVFTLYIDEKPVFFSQTRDLQRYSFKVEPGKHVVQLRITNQIIRLNNVEVPKGKKLILGINADSAINKMVKFISMPDTLTNYEAEQINKYLITVVPNFGDRMATIEQKDRLFLMNYSNGYYNYYSYNRPQDAVLIGPLADNMTDFTIKGGISKYFLAEHGYSFEFKKDLLKQKSWPVKYLFNKHLRVLPGLTDYKQYALTNQEVDSLWQNYLDMRSHESNIFNNVYNYNNGDGKLMLNVDSLKNGRAPFIKNIIVYKYDDPDYMFITWGANRDIGRFIAGRYRVFYLFRGNSYYIQEGVNIKPAGINYYSTGLITPHAPDSISLKIAKIIEAQGGGYNIDKTDAAQSIKEIFNNKYLDTKVFEQEMAGYVYDAGDKQAIPGVTVSVRGTNKGTVTNIAGFFKLKVPKTGKLHLSFVGYEPAEVNINPGHAVAVYLKPAAKYLQEVVVVGYGTQSKQSISGSVSGVFVSQLSGRAQGMNFTIRGNNSTPTGGTPLIVVDGVIYSGDMASLNADIIESIDIMNAGAGTNIYGARAANGVVIISTKKKNSAADGNTPQEATTQTMRHNFSDYAYWQPRLTTDEQGKATFKVTYPDDITNWRTFVVGITDKKQVGMAEGEVKAFKSLSANFTSPLFAIKGDSFSPLGKVLNYTADTVKLNRKFIYNGQLISDQNITLKNSRIDTFKLVAAGADSLSFAYTIKRGGYFDGERRSIPLFEQGTLETKGSFNTMERDTTITLQFDPNLKEATFRAEASVLPVLLDETEHLRNYEYLCNEQLASKLKALLAEKQIRAYLNQPFKWDNMINDLIKKLQNSRRWEGTWGWWKDTDEELWISLHVSEALLSAENKGYKVFLDKQKLIDYLVYQVTAYHGQDKLTAIALLKALNAKADLPAFVRDYELQLSPKIALTEYDKERLMLTRQIAGMPVVIDSLLKYVHHTMFGNIYWGQSSYQFFNNSVQQSLLAYRILKNEGKYPELLTKLRNYFLEQRQSGYWRNTYESAEILETILPDLLIKGQKPVAASLILSGGKNETVTKFPYTTTLPGAASLTVKKQGDFPVYVTAYQKFWNAAPEKVSKEFTVDTWFDKNYAKVSTAKGGEAIVLKAMVTAKADADYALVEIPIPAGCSYDGKEQGYGDSEVHREYFKNKVSIFCRKLTEGQHTFTVKLIARYSGTYHLNPAKAEMMYFPVLYGREGMKTFKVE